MNHQTLLALAIICAVLTASNSPAKAQDKPTDKKIARPNILWIYIEDMNDWMGTYGETLIKTPNIDALAGRGVRFDRAFMPAGVCSATRSAVITGTMQTSYGIHHHRSSRKRAPGEEIYLPQHLKTIPELFKKAGYWTSNYGKDDYNFIYDRAKLYDAGSEKSKFSLETIFGLWVGRRKGQPFFGQLQLKGGKNSGRVQSPTDPAKVKVMPYYPDHPIIRREIAHHYDCIGQTDFELKQIIDALKTEGLYDNTIVFFFTDHGFRMIRHKQFLYDGGIKVPLIIAGPGIEQGKVRADLVSGIDLAPTALAMAGIEIPRSMEGRDIFAKDYKPREFIIAARDRCDYTIDRIRAVRTEKFKYLRNFLTDRPYMQPQYRDGRDYLQIMKTLHKDGKLNEVQAAFMADKRIGEELYDVENDPHETINLAKDPKYAKELKRHQTILSKWMRKSRDQGQYPESEASLRGVFKRWGPKCVNPEYDKLRGK